MRDYVAAACELLGFSLDAEQLEAIAGIFEALHGYADDVAAFEAAQTP